MRVLTGDEMPIHDYDGRSDEDRPSRMTERTPRMSVQELTQTVRRGAYEVDPAAVASAMLLRPGVRRLLLGDAASDEVLEAGD